MLGGADAITEMVDRALTTRSARELLVTDVWVDATARRIISELEQRRATWQTWHVRAETERQIRAAIATVRDPEALTDRLVHAVITSHSVSLRGPAESDFDITPHPALARSAHGSEVVSVYSIAGAEKYTSPRILAAEQRLLAHAAETGAPVVPDHYGRLAVLEAAANGTPLNHGQASLVEQMATSGRRVQVAIAPAGSGKTTALRALAAAWTDAGGNVLALAPSAAAVGALNDSLTGLHAVHGDTLAKLTHELDTRPDQPSDWVASIGPSTLVIVDEAGMADTLTLDQIVHHAMSVGATVRLVGDDQQLAAIGAGGILRDITKTHGALRLDQLMRFNNPAEAEATLLLRDGDPTGLRFYETHERIHVGDEYSILDDVLHAWNHDRARGLDALMLAPTRDQVRDLNERAQALVNGSPDAVSVRLTDGLHGRVGDLIITRTNDRRLRLSATDWVTNGDRWHITHINPDGSVDVARSDTGLHAQLPAEYISASVELGYATTIHTAQGTTADTIHGLLPAGAERSMTRQDLYTMLTRGRRENHAYLPAAATTGDPHELIHPDAISPQTARETLERILDHDGAATSATTVLQAAHDPATLFQHATDRYTDALNQACETVISATAIDALTAHAEQLAPGITDQPAWPTLRHHLIHLAADDHDPAQLLDHVARRGRLDDAHDTAATLTWRLERAGLTTTVRTADPGEVPAAVQRDPRWRHYLTQRQAASDNALRQLTAITEAQPADPVADRLSQANRHRDLMRGVTPSREPSRGQRR